ncbi:hypothetical protein [Mycolicibacterium thermoresistibile]
MLAVPSAPLMVSRRRVLLGTAALALLGAAATSCGAPPPPPEVDELVAQLDRARTDSQLATDAAATARPEQRRPLHTVADERAAHAEALSDEIARIIGPEAAATSTATPTSTTAEPVRPPDYAEVVGALRRSAESAAHLASQLSGYRAGLLGSIAAACTAAVTVTLGAPERPA